MKQTDPSQPTPTPFSSALVELLVLFLLQKKPMYTYALANEIKTLSQGRLPIPRLYNTMVKLKSAGAITEVVQEISDNRTRVYYALTPKGSQQLEEMSSLLTFLYQLIHEADHNQWSAHNDICNDL